MKKKTAIVAFLTIAFATPAVQAACTSGRLYSEVLIEFTVKPPRSGESGSCTIDLTNPEPTLGNIINGKFNVCVTDSFIAQLNSASLKVARNCSFSLKGSFDGGSFTANGKIDPNFAHGLGTITIKDGSRRQSGKFELWDTNQNRLNAQAAKLKSRSVQ